MYRGRGTESVSLSLPLLLSVTPSVRYIPPQSSVLLSLFIPLSNRPFNPLPLLFLSLFLPSSLPLCTYSTFTALSFGLGTYSSQLQKMQREDIAYAPRKQEGALDFGRGTCCTVLSHNQSVDNIFFHSSTISHFMMLSPSSASSSF